MCGRFDRHSELNRFTELIDDLVLEGAPELVPSYNIAPSQKALAVAHNKEGLLKAAALDWGLLPNWVDKTAMTRPINARAESIAEKPMFRSAFANRRCVVLCDGYYEWSKTAGGKQPYYFHMPQRRPFVMAGLWESNRKFSQSPIYSFCLVTREATNKVASVHHRMPVILDKGAIRQWLSTDSSTDDLLNLISDQTAEEINHYPILKFVNSPSNNTPMCFEPITVD
jgi:putative SOS response-associated peptidase YedK